MGVWYTNNVGVVSSLRLCVLLLSAAIVKDVPYHAFLHECNAFFGGHVSHMRNMYAHFETQPHAGGCTSYNMVCTGRWVVYNAALLCASGWLLISVCGLSSLGYAKQFVKGK